MISLLCFTLLYFLFSSFFMSPLAHLQFPIHFPVANPYSLIVGTFLIHATSIATHAGIPGKYWSSAMAQDKKSPNWVDQSEFKRNQGVFLLLELAFGFIQTYMTSTLVNLTRVNSWNHCWQLGLFLWLGYVTPEVYRSFVWENRPRNLCTIKLAQGFVHTVVLTSVLFAMSTR
ncbi:hypothetical protein K450DRAFT_254031 [Umbelopsis ramanniana AG]|uniref:Uncharacterized protein n=1 Tax=Umbelopsis ramanniana AG TaxID=1314678 RepID=A0AAD5E544_UMBRA|nr:uncharacterized protein K450DRAFT_254031 [Umbelopsis ramanniana AG]KAI8577027.1 hypothetical protein K450DRAFT_254031 [Umbelopsis ramanniana AG]